MALDESSRDGDNALVASGATVTACPVGGMMYVRINAGEALVCGQLFTLAQTVKQPRLQDRTKSSDITWEMH